jgi:hypothetical protein
MKNENEEIGINEVKELKEKVKEKVKDKGKEKNKKNDQIKRLSKSETDLAVTVESEIPYNGAQNPGVQEIIKNIGALFKNPDPYTLGVQCVCVKLLTDSLLNALLHDQYERKENFNTKLMEWEVSYLYFSYVEKKDT